MFRSDFLFRIFFGFYALQFLCLYSYRFIVYLFSLSALMGHSASFTNIKTRMKTRSCNRKNTKQRYSTQIMISTQLQQKRTNYYRLIVNDTNNRRCGGVIFWSRTTLVLLLLKKWMEANT